MRAESENLRRLCLDVTLSALLAQDGQIQLTLAAVRLANMPEDLLKSNERPFFRNKTERYRDDMVDISKQLKMRKKRQ